MPILEWSATYVLGVPDMDRIHEQFIHAVNTAAAASDADFLGLYQALLDHTVDHFEQERQWMLQLGFAADHCHIGEHERVLKVLRAVFEKIQETGDMALGRRVLGEMAPWFDQHASIMDGPLSHYLKEGQYSQESGCGCGPVATENGL